MKALSLTQPWATLVALGEKRIETRSWSTKYRGPLAIHAAKSFPEDCRDLCDSPPFRDVLRRYGLGASDLPRGCVIATVQLVGCIDARDAWLGMLDCDGQFDGKLTANLGQGYRVVGTIGKYERDFGNYAPSRFAWLLQDVVCSPVPLAARGAQRLWEWQP